MSLVLQKVRKRFPEFDMDVSLSAGKGEFLTLLGPSGCGKTTTLNIIAGFIEPESGSILIDGKEVTGLQPHLRRIGLVFQDYALFPTMDVFGNVSFGLRARGWSRADTVARVRELLALVRLERYERRKVTELSGGEQQRVALARALAPEPDLLLLDEPLSALDAQLRKDLRGEIRRIQRELGVTTVYVTHDQEEALAISDTVVVMREGRVEQAGTPSEIYHRPESTFVAGFVGIGNLLHGSVSGKRGKYLALHSHLGAFSAPGPGILKVGDEALLLFRPESCALERSAGTRKKSGSRGGINAATSGGRHALNRIEGTVRSCEYLGDSTLLEVQAEAQTYAHSVTQAGALADGETFSGDVFIAKLSGLIQCLAGERVRLSFSPGECWLLPAGARERR